MTLRKVRKYPRATPWEISEEQRALIPDISGNTITGLGETKERRPSIVYWPNDRAFDTIAHGDMIRYFYDRPNAPEVVAVRRDEKNRAPKVLDPKARFLPHRYPLSRVSPGLPEPARQRYKWSAIRRGRRQVVRLCLEKLQVGRVCVS